MLMAAPVADSFLSDALLVCINEILTDDELRSVLAKLDAKDKDNFGLVCKRWLNLQSLERKRLAVRAGSHMLIRLATRFCGVVELNLSQSVSRSFYPGVTDKDLDVVAAKFTGLKVLHLKNCKGITDDGLIQLGQGLSSLQSLDVTCCRKLTDKGLKAVAKGCHDLTRLNLAGCRYVTDMTLISLSENCCNLEELSLQGCSYISDNGITSLVSGCQRIKTLDLSKCSDIGDIGVCSVAKTCSSHLRTLKLLDCYKIKDESVVSLAEFCKNLQTLVISGCREITNEAIKSLAFSCGNSLKNLRMDWCLNISDSALSCVLAQCRNLEALDIGCCEEITDAAFESGGIELGLKVLRVSNCRDITAMGIQSLLGKCRSLEYIDLRSCPRATKADCEEAGIQFPECCKVNFVGSLSDPDLFVF